MILKNFEIHIVHYELLKERRSYLEKRLKYFGLEKFCFWHIQKINQDFSNLKKKYYELRYWEIKKDYNTYWLNGYLTYQGTIYGDIYPSSLFPTRVKEYYQRIPFYKKIILDFIKNTEAKRFNKSIFSKIQVNLLDLLIFLKNSIHVLDKR